MDSEESIEDVVISQEDRLSETEDIINSDREYTHSKAIAKY